MRHMKMEKGMLMRSVGKKVVKMAIMKDLRTEKNMCCLK
jgi:hypothetical protein